VKKAFLLIGFALLLQGFVFASAQKEGPQTATGAPAKVTYWEGLGRAASKWASLKDHPGWIELQKRTNVQVEFITPSVGNEPEQFNLMVASKNYPDIVTYTWLTVPGGPASYIADKVIIRLNEPMDKWAPDAKKAFVKFPVAKRQATLDDGTLYVFPNIYADPALAHFNGPMVRGDILKKVPGVDMSKFPGNMETLAEWEQVLRAAKAAGLKGSSGKDLIPYSFMMSFLHTDHMIIGAYGISTRFTHIKGEPVYGPATPQFKDFLVLMNRWFKDGLIDSEFAANNAKMYDEKVLDNRVLVFEGAMGGQVTRYTGLARPKNAEFVLNALKYPVINKGDRPLLGFRTPDYTGTGAAITTACKNVEAAVRLLNYDYSEPGYVLANFGVEGTTFNWDKSVKGYTDPVFHMEAKGYPRYSDLIMKNTDGLSRDQATGVFVRVGNYVGIKSLEFLEQRDSLPEQLGPNGRGLWMQTLNEMWLPPVYPTPEESREFAKLTTELNTYSQEMTVKFIMGAEPIDKVPEFQATLKKMNVDRATEIMRAQLKRYFARP
jgi:putative aldouronate transport system substrate-binding protein